MIESENVEKVLHVIAKDIIGVSKNKNNFQKLPDSFWGYYAKGHDKVGKFGFIVTYSESESDIDDLLKMYESWLSKNKN